MHGYQAGMTPIRLVQLSCIYSTELSIFCEDVMPNEEVSLQSNKTNNYPGTRAYLHCMNAPMQVFEVKNSLAIFASHISICTLSYF